MPGYLDWIAELSDLYGEKLDPSNATWREIYEAGETPQTVVAEWPPVPVIH